MRETICAICETKNNANVIYPPRLIGEQINSEVFSARRMSETKRSHYRIVQCKNCGLYRSDPVLESSELQKLYLDSEFTYGSETGNLKQTYGGYIQTILPNLPAKENYLDIGCGNGFMLEKAKELGFVNVFGVEPGEKPVALARADIRPQITIGFFESGMYQENFFDLITIFQTLDHLENPKVILKECFKILKPGGVILLINHDLGAPLNRLLGERSPIVDIEHTYLFNRRAQALLLQESGFRDLRTFAVKNIFSMEYLAQLMPVGKSTRKFFMKIIGFLRLKDKTVKLKLGNLGIVGLK